MVVVAGVPPDWGKSQCPRELTPRLRPRHVRGIAHDQRCVPHAPQVASMWRVVFEMVVEARITSALQCREMFDQKDKRRAELVVAVLWTCFVEEPPLTRPTPSPRTFSAGSLCIACRASEQCCLFKPVHWH